MNNIQFDTVMSEPDEVGEPAKIRLRPMAALTREELIKMNLSTLNDNASKKKRAQAHYYNKITGRSPLLVDNDSKPPVHARLGTASNFGNRNKRKVPMIGTNTNLILPKSKYSQRGNNRKMFSAQERIQRIRNQPYTMNTKRIRLQRDMNIANLKVQVVNNSAENLMCPRFKMVLNPIFQQEIRQIQVCSPRQIIHGVHPIIPTSTMQTLNDRFSRLT